MAWLRILAIPRSLIRMTTFSSFVWTSIRMDLNSLSLICMCLGTWKTQGPPEHCLAPLPKTTESNISRRNETNVSELQETEMKHTNNTHMLVMISKQIIQPCV